MKREVAAVLLFLVAFISCNEMDLPPNCRITRPENNAVFQVGDSITVSIEATDPGGSIREILLYFDGYGIVSLKEFPYTYSIGTGSFAPDSYYIKATALDEEGMQTSDEIQIILSSQLASVETREVTSISHSSAVSGGEITYNGGTAITAKGVCWGTNSTPTLSNSHTMDGSGTGSFISTMTGLNCESTYYTRAYVTNAAGTSYGAPIEFTTNPCPLLLPTVITSPVNNTTEYSATGGGSVINDGGGEIISRGVCWSISKDPTLADSYTTDGNGLGVFTSEIAGLICGTKYYLRAYATNPVGTSYGDQVSFTTEQCTVQPPAVSTTSATSIAPTSAKSGGSINWDGGSGITERGVCWSISEDPTTSDERTIDGTGTGSFTSTITGLSCNTLYFIRAYATNGAGTGYGEQKSFTTTPCSYLPEVSTTPLSGVTKSGAVSGGNVTSEGGTSVTARGVCWSKSDNPTILDNRTNDGTGPGSFTSTITGLESSTIYYIRAYATNDSGTSYGNQFVFRTN